MPPAFSNEPLPCLIQTALDWLARFPACIPLTLTHKKKHQLQRDPCSFYPCRHISTPLEFYTCDMSVTWLSLLSPILRFFLFMLSCLHNASFFYFRPVTEKKTPLLRNHSICSGPQRSPSTLNILYPETSISNGFAWIWALVHFLCRLIFA